MSTILVIDDDELFRGLLRAAFRKSGHEVAVAEDGIIGVERAREVHPDLIVTDMSMPGMTGWDVLRALKSEVSTQGIPVVALSAHRTTEDYDEAYREGCAAYLVKPVAINELMNRVEELLAA